MLASEANGAPECGAGGPAGLEMLGMLPFAHAALWAWDVIWNRMLVRNWFQAIPNRQKRATNATTRAVV